MPSSSMRNLASLLVAAAIIGFAAEAKAQPIPAAPIAAPETYQNLLTTILQGNQTIIGQDIAEYPTGTAPLVTAAIVTIPPGGETGWHVHAVPLFVYVLSGVVTVDYGTAGTNVYQPGTGFLEAMNWPHNGMNPGTEPVSILAVYMGASGIANATAAAAPQKASLATDSHVVAVDHLSTAGITQN